MTVAARIGVRAATTADAESVAAIYAPVVTGTAISFEDTAPRRTGPGLGGRRAADGRPLCADAGGSYSSG
jgi:hypothetical protein